MSRFSPAIAQTAVASLLPFGLPLGLLLGLSLGLVSGCKLDPETPKLVYSLNEEALATSVNFERDLSSQAQLDGALRMFFGTPAAPAFYARADWLDDDFYPSTWTLDEASDEFLDDLVAQNRDYFAKQLAVLELEQALPSEVQVPRFALDLQLDWQAHLDLLFEEDGPDGDMDAVLFEQDGVEYTWISEAIYLFTDYYPDLATTAETYRQQCYHCHGASGGGDGSTAPYLNPRPRDYRPGKFKFTALNEKARPRHEDLMRILEEGIYTTAMPSFKRFPKSMLSGLADYVRLLSIRGETEILVISDYDVDRGFNLDNALEMYELTVDRWREAPDKLIVFDDDVPEVTPEGIERGRALFMSETGANCISCHGSKGRGDGVSAWETGMVNEEYVKDDWGNEVSPRDLTRGLYRLGRRPIDIYRRIYAGINGTPMPAHIDMQITEADGSKRRLEESDLWDLVAFVRSLPSLTDRNARPVRQDDDGHGDGDGHDADSDGHAEGEQSEGDHDENHEEGGH